MGRIRISVVAALAATTLAVLVSASGAMAATYSVTILNLTKGQPLSPPVIATHYANGQVFNNGSYARYGVQQVAENGGVPVLYSELQTEQQLGWFDDVQRSMAGPLVPNGLPASSGNPNYVRLTISAGTAKRISWVSMLACTNDGFAGVNGLRLPKRIGEYAFSLAGSYDAGSERNTESFVDLVGGCQAAVGVKSSTGATGTGMSNPLLWEGHRIRHHRGISGNAADGLVPSVHGWHGPVGAMWVQRIS